VGYLVVVFAVERASGACTSVVGSQDDATEVLDTFCCGWVQRRSLRCQAGGHRVRRGPAATLAAFRAAAPRRAAPECATRTEGALLGEAFVHGEDIRRHLGISHAYPVDKVVAALGLYVRSNAIIGGKERVAALTLKAIDTDFSVGSGPLVTGPAVSLLLASSGRKSALADLSGPGVQVLQGRP
jgi:uncharacterized protein (TIGR03083 family)